MNVKSKYSHDDKKHIAELIENLKNHEDYIAIFEILMQDASNSYTINNNGVFLNLATVSDNTLTKIKKCLRNINRVKNNEIEIDVDVIPINSVQKTSRAYKLSNYEKNIIKQRDLKKILNEDDDNYEELTFSAKSSSRKKSQKLIK